MATLLHIARDPKTLEIETTNRDGFPFRMVITLKKLGQVSMLDYFLSSEEAEGLMKALDREKGLSK